MLASTHKKATRECNCGYLTDNSGRCKCTPFDIQRYRARLSGPLLDRIDIHVEVPRVQYDKLTGQGENEPSCAVRARVASPCCCLLQR